MKAKLFQSKSAMLLALVGTFLTVGVQATLTPLDIANDIEREVSLAQKQAAISTQQALSFSYYANRTSFTPSSTPLKVVEYTPQSSPVITVENSSQATKQNKAKQVSLKTSHTTPNKEQQLVNGLDIAEANRLYSKEEQPLTYFGRYYVENNQRIVTVTSNQDEKAYTKYFAGEYNEILVFASKDAGPMEISYLLEQLKLPASKIKLAPNPPSYDLKHQPR